MSLCTETGTHTRPHTLTHTYPFGPRCPDAHNRADTCTCTHRCTPGAHAASGAQVSLPGRVTHACQFPLAGPQPGSLPAWVRQARTSLLGRGSGRSPCQSGAQPCASGANSGVWVSPFLPWCLLLGWAALPWSQGPCALLSSWGPALPCHPWVQGGSTVVSLVCPSIRPDLLGSQPARLCT